MEDLEDVLWAVWRNAYFTVNYHVVELGFETKEEAEAIRQVFEDRKHHQTYYARPYRRDNPPNLYFRYSQEEYDAICRVS